MAPIRYTELPVEEKGEDEIQQLDAIPTTRASRSRKWALFLGLPLLFLAAFMTFILANDSKTQPEAESTNEYQEWIREHEPRAAGDQYLLGVGKADITGPIVELNFMGYASLSQVGTGLRQRIYSRAFIIGDVNNPNDRFVYLVLDTQSGDTAVRYGILEALAALGGEYSIYTQGNVAVTGTHQHSGPGAWVNYLLPQVTSLGFSKQSWQAIVDGAVLSIQRAHESVAPGYLSYGSTNVTDASISRSLYAYLANPAAERALYSSEVDQELTMLRFQRASDSKNIGVLTWFPVHGTSMLENNTHVTGDNKGVAAWMFEQAVASDSSAAEGFVAGFSQANVGDTTPNVLGAWCDDGSGQQCTLENSTCAGVSETCHGRGPLFQALDLGVSSCYEIGRRQFAPAKALYDSFDSVSTPLVDTSVKSYHFFQDMQYFEFPLENGTTVQTCPAALGYSFAAGTTDGPGAFDFTQNSPGSDADPLWNVVSDLLRTPSAAQVACQQPKPILLDVGEMSVPYDWSPNIVDIQSLRVGQFIIIVSPSEATTMTGRRWRKAVHDAAISSSITTSEPKVVLGGPANTYAHYVATPEEYGIQRYEGASTLYGQWESTAYIYLHTSNIKYLAAGSTTSPPPGPSPPNNVNVSLSFIAGVVFDSAPIGKSFGQVTAQPAASYAPGAVVNTTFIAADPRNNLRLEGTYVSVQSLGSDGKTWTQVRDDSDWSTVLTWYRDSTILGTSHVVISWETEADVAPGTYRVVYNGDSKSITGSISSFSGISNSFKIT